MKQLLGFLLVFVCCMIASGFSSGPSGAGEKPDLVEVYKLIDGKELDFHVFYPGSWSMSV